MSKGRKPKIGDDSWNAPVIHSKPFVKKFRKELKLKGKIERRNKK